MDFSCSRGGKTTKGRYFGTPCLINKGHHQLWCSRKWQSWEPENFEWYPRIVPQCPHCRCSWGAVTNIVIVPIVNVAEKYRQDILHLCRARSHRGNKQRKLWAPQITLAQIMLYFSAISLNDETDEEDIVGRQLLHKWISLCRAKLRRACSSTFRFAFDLSCKDRQRLAKIGRAKWASDNRLSQGGTNWWNLGSRFQKRREGSNFPLKRSDLRQ